LANNNSYWNYDEPSLYLSIEEQSELDVLSTLIELSIEETTYLLSVWRSYSTAEKAGKRKELIS
jgi:hypothetical protein